MLRDLLLRAVGAVATISAAGATVSLLEILFMNADHLSVTDLLLLHRLMIV